MKLYQDIPNIQLNEISDFGIILCGGGAAGRWQAGVMLSLAQINLLKKAKVIIGTSVGGLNAALFCVYGGYITNESDNSSLIPVYNTIIGVWESIKKNEDVYKGKLENFLDNIGAFFGFIFNRPSLLDPTPLYNRIDNLFGKMTLEEASKKLNRHVIVSALDLNSQKEEFYCSFGPNKHVLVADALKRTSAIPCIFKSVKGTDLIKNKITTHWHVDGGVGANIPLVALNHYNLEFPGNKIKKIIIIYCYPDEMTDISMNNTKNYEGLRDVILGLIPSTMNAQEQMVEEWAKIMTNETDWDILALYPSEKPCDALDFTKTELLQKGYEYGVNGKGYSYRDECEINIIDFLKRK